MQEGKTLTEGVLEAPAKIAGAEPGNARSQTFGEYRVGVSFNPSQSTTVDLIKRKAAELIDIIAAEQNLMNGARNGEAARCASIAMTEIESAAMWAVKAVTKGMPPHPSVTSSPRQG